MADIKELVEKLSGVLDDKAFEASDTLAHTGSEEVLTAVIEILKHPAPESRFIAARTLGLIKDNAAALSSLLEALRDKENKDQLGDLLAFLEGFDVSDIYVELFKYYLFGSFKVSTVAKDLLDHKEFNITARVIKKATKHWDHYSNNVNQDEVYALKKIEVEEMLADLRGFVEETESE